MQSPAVVVPPLAQFPSLADTLAARAGVVLASHFQPILSLSHRRVVGHEALLRGVDGEGRARSPAQLFDTLAAEQPAAFDQAVAARHVHCFAGLQAAAGTPQWLFVNLQPPSFTQAMQRGSLLDLALQALGSAAPRLVIEVTEDVLAMALDLEAGAARARNLGCLLALDDFGAGHSNFDRVWRLQPEIVKLDRSLVQRAAREAKAGRIVAQMVSLLHECGSLVLMEGIETTEEASLALDCDADLVQGYYFGRPQAGRTADAHVAAPVSEVWRAFDQRSHAAHTEERARTQPYVQALLHAAHGLATRQPLAAACEDFLALPDAQLCYLLDSRGVQTQASALAPGFIRGELHRFAPMRDTAQACWARRPYFRRALEAPGTVQLTRPYLSIQGAHLCVTLSVALTLGAQTVVLCGDLAWHR